MNTMKGLLLFAFGAGLGYCGCYFRKEIGEFVKSFVKNMKEPESEIAEAKAGCTDAAKEEFRRVADKFSGIYESLYRSAKAEETACASVIEDWNARVKSLNSAPMFQRLWNSRKETRIAEVLSFFQACGIERDERQKVLADSKTRYAYVLASQEPVEEGKEYEVFFPCWTLGDKVLEKGTLKKV